MVGVFRRSLSFQHPAGPPKPPVISHHTRSVSLPTRSHPLVSQLKDSLAELKTRSSAPSNRTTAWLIDCLARLKAAHESLDDALQVPQTQAALARHPQLIEKLLEDFLHFVDIYGIFQTLILSLKEEQTAAQVAIRKRDEAGVEMYVKSLKKTSKEIQKLISAVRSIEKRHGNVVIAPVPRVRPEMDAISVVMNGVEVTVGVSLALFNGISESFSTSKRRSYYSWTKLSTKAAENADESIEELRGARADCKGLTKELRKMKDEEVRMALRRMEELESCIGEIEGGSGKVFRSLISTRVSLLNSLTH